MLYEYHKIYNQQDIERTRNRVVERKKHPTKVGRERYSPDGYYTANGENVPCICKETCPGGCKGQCGCLACHDAYGDFLSGQGG